MHQDLSYYYFFYLLISSIHTPIICFLITHSTQLSRYLPSYIHSLFYSNLSPISLILLPMIICLVIIYLLAIYMVVTEMDLFYSLIFFMILSSIILVADMMNSLTSYYFTHLIYSLYLLTLDSYFCIDSHNIVKFMLILSHSSIIAYFMTLNQHSFSIIFISILDNYII